MRKCHGAQGLIPVCNSWTVADDVVRTHDKSRYPKNPIIRDHAGARLRQPAPVHPRGGPGRRRVGGGRVCGARRAGSSDDRAGHGYAGSRRRCSGCATLAPSAGATTDELGDPLTTYEAVTTYNNYYEFGTDKSDPAVRAKNFKTEPWTVQVGGLVNKPGPSASRT